MPTFLEQLSQLQAFDATIRRLAIPATPEGFTRNRPLPSHLSYLASNITSFNGRNDYEEYQSLLKADYHLRVLEHETYVVIETGKTVFWSNAEPLFKQTYTKYMEILAGRKDEHDRSALHLAIEHGLPLFVEELLKHGADIKAPFPSFVSGKPMGALAATKYFAKKMDDGKPETKKRYEEVDKILRAHGAKPEVSANKSKYEYSFHSKQTDRKTRAETRDEKLHQVKHK